MAKNRKQKKSGKGYSSSCMRWTAIVILIIAVIVLGVGVMNLMWGESKTKTGSDTGEIAMVAGGALFMIIAIVLLVVVCMKLNLASLGLLAICCFCCMPSTTADEAEDEPADEPADEAADEEAELV